VVKVIPRQMDAGKLLQPKIIPKEIKQIQEDEAPPSASVGVTGGVPGGVSGGAVGGVLGGILGAVPSAAPPPKPVEKKAAPRPSIIPVGGRVQNALLTHRVDPVYPQIAKSARISGTVELSATISEDGHILELKVVSGHPLLRQAAIDAVKQWVYKPTLLNEQAVKVSTTIDVIFTLSQ
jgi:protein TonB